VPLQVVQDAVLLLLVVGGAEDGLFFHGANGRQANPWDDGASYQCVVPPVKRGGAAAGYRDPWNTSNQTTGLSDAIELLVEP